MVHVILPFSQLQVVSCEMIEAVGHEHMEAYFRTLGAMVKPGGRVVIQVGGSSDAQAHGLQHTACSTWPARWQPVPCSPANPAW